MEKALLIMLLETWQEKLRILDFATHSEVMFEMERLIKLLKDTKK